MEFSVSDTPGIVMTQFSPCLSLAGGGKIVSNNIMNHDDVLMIMMISGWMVIPHLPRYEDDSPRPDQFCPGEEN